LMFFVVSARPPSTASGVAQAERFSRISTAERTKSIAMGITGFWSCFERFDCLGHHRREC
jgi:hypothetical protein